MICDNICHICYIEDLHDERNMPDVVPENDAGAVLESHECGFRTIQRVSRNRTGVVPAVFFLVLQ